MFDDLGDECRQRVKPAVTPVAVAHAAGQLRDGVQGGQVGFGSGDRLFGAGEQRDDDVGDAASGDCWSLVIATAGLPWSRAADTTAVISGELPDCEIASTAPRDSSGGDSPSYSQGAASATGSLASRPSRYCA